MNEAMVLVDHDFDVKHVGVRRVIQWYCASLQKLGFTWNLCTVRRGKIVALKTHFVLDDFFPDERNPYADKATLIGDTFATADIEASSNFGKKSRLAWHSFPLNPQDFAFSVITNPWLAGLHAMDLQQYRFDVGVVHDMVPNLIAAGVLNFPTHVDARAFAQEHTIGYVFYKSNCRSIASVSENTRRDFESMFGVPTIGNHVLVPFDPGKLDYSAIPRAKTKPQILMVNALDERKNFRVAEAVLGKLSKEVEYDLVVLGAERVDPLATTKFFSKVSQHPGDTTWIRSYSDKLYQESLLNADLLFFPSQYEGLGLPILEAQDLGLPVVSGNRSSCKEINLNSNLMADPDDVDGLVEVLCAQLTGNLKSTSGEALVRQLSGYLANLTSLEDALSSL